MWVLIWSATQVRSKRQSPYVFVRIEDDDVLLVEDPAACGAVIWGPISQKRFGFVVFNEFLAK